MGSHRTQLTSSQAMFCSAWLDVRSPLPGRGGEAYRRMYRFVSIGARVKARDHMEWSRKPMLADVKHPVRIPS